MRLFLILLSLFCAAPALAAGPAKEGPARPVFEPSGDFGFCIGDKSFADGRKITFAFSTKEQINIGLTIPAGGFKIGGKYDLLLALDDAEGRKVRAEALDEETLLLQMGANPKFKKTLAASKNLTVGAGGKNIAFALPPMSALMDGLQKCVKDNAGKRDEKMAQIEQALPEPLKALLITAGFQDIAPVDLERVPPENRPADFVWRTGKIMGGVREREMPAGKSLSDLVGLHMKGLEKKCEGKFSADIEREQTAPGMKLRLAEATCQAKNPKEPSIIVGAAFYVTEGGIFTVFTHEAAEADKKDVLEARNRIGKALLKLAKDSAQ